MSKVALITGSSRGIGAATAVRLAQDGFDVCVNYVNNLSAALEVVQKVKSKGVKAIPVKADISKEDQVIKMFQTLDAELGSINVLVNNAGILFKQARIIEMSAARVNQVLQTNVTGYFLCCREAILRMSNRRGGSGGAIVNVSSAASRLGSAGEYIDYAASKGAIDTLTIGLSKEVAEEGVRVNCVRPGLIHTDIHADGGEPDRVNRLKESLPLKRGGRPEEVAAAISWLVSGESAYTTGAFIEVSGGR